MAPVGIPNPPFSHLTPYPAEPIELPPRYQNHTPDPPRPDPVIVDHSNPQAVNSNIDQHRYEPVPASDGPYLSFNDQRPPSPPQIVQTQPVDDAEFLHSSKASEDTPIFTRKEYVLAFMFDTLPRRCYLYLHLGLPASTSRASRVYSKKLI